MEESDIDIANIANCFKLCLAVKRHCVVAVILYVSVHWKYFLSLNSNVFLIVLLLQTLNVYEY